MLLGHCRDGAHHSCGGEQRDRGDGTIYRCDCRCHGALTCPDCPTVTKDGDYCGECLSERAEYYVPDKGEAT